VSANLGELGLVEADDVAPVGGEPEERTAVDERIGFAQDVVARTRPAVGFWLGHQAGADGVALDIPGHRQEVAVLLDRERVEALLEEVAPHALPEVDGARIAAVGFPDGARQGGRLRRHQHEVDVIRHQAPGQDLHLVLRRERGEEL